MSNKPHLRPHKKRRQASRNVRLLVAILFLAIFALAVALAVSGRYVPAGRLPLLRGGRRLLMAIQGILEDVLAAVFRLSASNRQIPLLTFPSGTAKVSGRILRLSHRSVEICSRGHYLVVCALNC